MIITNQKCKTNFNLKTDAFKINFSPIAFDILSSKLYKDPLYAMIRELLCNAYDSQIKKGNPDTPIEVTLPHWKTGTNLVIRDFGTGMDDESIHTVYTCFFNSTKSSSNDFTGCFGLGSKTPFAFTDVFQVRSFQNGKVNTYLCTKAEGIPGITSLSMYDDTDEPDGLEISIPFTNTNTDKLVRYFERFLAFIPEIKVNGVTFRDFDKHKTVIIPNKLYYYDLKDILSGKANIDTDPDNKFLGTFIKQGQNVYKVKLPNPEEIEFSYKYASYLNHNTYVYEVPIGTLQVTPSRDNFREDEAYNKVCEEFTKEIFNIMLNTFKEHNIEEIISKNLDDIYCGWFNKKINKQNRKIFYLDILFNHSVCIRIHNLDVKELRSSNEENTFTVTYATYRFPNKQKNLIVFLDEKHDKVPVRKLRMMAEQLKYNNMTVVKSTDFDVYQEVKDTLKNISSISSLGFEFDCFTYKEFNEKIKGFNYIPNSNKHKKLIYCFSMYNSYDGEFSSSYKNEYAFNATYPPAYTLTITTEGYNDLKDIFNFKHDIIDTSGGSFIKSLFFNQVRKQGINMPCKELHIVVENIFTKDKDYKEFNISEFIKSIIDTDFIFYCINKESRSALHLLPLDESVFNDIAVFLEKYKEKFKRFDLYDIENNYLCNTVKLYNEYVKKLRKTHYMNWTWIDIVNHPIIVTLQKYSDKDILEDKVKFIPESLTNTSNYLLKRLNTLGNINREYNPYVKLQKLFKFFRRKKNVLF